MNRTNSLSAEARRLAKIAPSPTPLSHGLAPWQGGTAFWSVADRGPQFVPNKLGSKGPLTHRGQETARSVVPDRVMAEPGKGGGLPRSSRDDTGRDTFLNLGSGRGEAPSSTRSRLVFNWRPSGKSTGCLYGSGYG